MSKRFRHAHAIRSLAPSHTRTYVFFLKLKKRETEKKRTRERERKETGRFNSIENQTRFSSSSRLPAASVSGVKKTSRAPVHAHATTRNDSLAYLLMCEFTCGARDSPAGTHTRTYIHTTHAHEKTLRGCARSTSARGVRRAYKRSFAGAVYGGLGSMSHTCRPVLPARHVTTFL